MAIHACSRNAGNVNIKTKYYQQYQIINYKELSGKRALAYVSSFSMMKTQINEA